MCARAPDSCGCVCLLVRIDLTVFAFVRACVCVCARVCLCVYAGGLEPGRDRSPAADHWVRRGHRAASRGGGRRQRREKEPFPAVPGDAARSSPAGQLQPAGVGTCASPVGLSIIGGSCTVTAVNAIPAGAKTVVVASASHRHPHRTTTANHPLPLPPIPWYHHHHHHNHHHHRHHAQDFCDDSFCICRVPACGGVWYSSPQPPPFSRRRQRRAE